MCAGNSACRLSGTDRAGRRVPDRRDCGVGFPERDFDCGRRRFAEPSIRRSDGALAGAPVFDSSERGLISCVFDRVVIRRDERGMPLRVQLVDYKSDRPEDPEYYRTTYSAQLERYASVLRELFQVPVEQVIFLLRSGKTLILSSN